jgi:hypothetical protein
MASDRPVRVAWHSGVRLIAGQEHCVRSHQRCKYQRLFRKRRLDVHDCHDWTRSHRNGAYQGEVAFRQPGAIRSEPDYAIGLNGKNAFVLVSNSTAFSQPTSRRGLTVEAWLRPDVLIFEGQTADHYVHWRQGRRL